MFIRLYVKRVFRVSERFLVEAFSRAFLSAPIFVGQPHKKLAFTLKKVHSGCCGRAMLHRIHSACAPGRGVPVSSSSHPTGFCWGPSPSPAPGHPSGPLGASTASPSVSVLKASDKERGALVREQRLHPRWALPWQQGAFAKPRAASTIPSQGCSNPLTPTHTSPKEGPGDWSPPGSCGQGLGLLGTKPAGQ